MDQKIRLLLIDDHALFRSGVKLFLSRQDDLEVVGEASDGIEGLKRVRQLNPDVVLLDLHMPGMSGLEVLQLILQDAPETFVLMLTVSEDAEDLSQALRLGAAGYLLKNIDADQLVDSIHRAYHGEAVISPQMTSKLVQQFRDKPADEASRGNPGDHEKLTPREREILLYIARGDSNKIIARRLDIAESTVKIHVQNILKKLDLSSRVQAAIYAIEHHLVS